MAKKFLEGLAWGAGFSIALLAAVVLFFGFVLWALPLLERSETGGPASWSKFTIMNSSHRFVVGTEYHDGLHISGELKFEELPPFDRFWIAAIVRDEDGALVDWCSDKFYTHDVLDMVQPFGLECESVVDPAQFANYEFTVRRWY